MFMDLSAIRYVQQRAKPSHSITHDNEEQSKLWLSRQVRERRDNYCTQYIYCEALKGYFSFKVKFEDFAICGIGICDKRYTQSQSQKRNRIYYLSTGNLQILEKEEEKLTKYIDRDIVEVIGNLQKGIIKWLINGQVYFRLLLSEYAVPQIESWVPYFLMNQKGKAIVYESKSNLETNYVDWALKIYEWDDDLLCLLHSMIEFGI